ncbi:transposable element Tcb2 transposase [Trichonephila clavipes]|nr:transposable element Tcb2 transposase [Trichonephila clavipes]
MTSQRYVHDILQPHVLPLIFQQDNARPRMARVSQDCLRTVTTLPWPVRSPDLSPIKHIWNHLGPRVRHPTSLNEPEARLQQIWNETSHIIQNSYARSTQCPIVSHFAFALQGVQQGIKSSIFVPFSPK